MARDTRYRLLAAVGVLLFVSLPGFADSQARIVRLSDVEGQVQADRHTGEGFERAIVNMPITQGMLLRTGNDGRAEVEFEDGTVVRMAPDTQIDFEQLSLRSSGAKNSRVALDEGTAYFNVQRQRKDQFTIVAAQREIPITHSVHLRVNSGDKDLKFAVYDGELSIKQEGEQIKIKKNEELTLDLTGGQNVLAKKIEPGPFDEWDKSRTGYHERYYTASGYSSYPYYGRGDLGYYGGWYDVPGYGTLWQPYNIGYGWNPFSSGYWGWYPSFGYMWVSGYPWGWLPYRYGSWSWVPGWGWGWMPGSYWGPGMLMPGILTAPMGFVTPTPPATANRPLSPVITKPIGSLGTTRKFQTPQIVHPGEPMANWRKASPGSSIALIPPGEPLGARVGTRPVISAPAGTAAPSLRAPWIRPSSPPTVLPRGGMRGGMFGTGRMPAGTSMGHISTGGTGQSYGGSHSGGGGGYSGGSGHSR